MELLTLIIFVADSIEGNTTNVRRVKKLGASRLPRSVVYASTEIISSQPPIIYPSPIRQITSIGLRLPSKHPTPLILRMYYVPQRDLEFELRKFSWRGYDWGHEGSKHNDGLKWLW